MVKTKTKYAYIAIEYSTERESWSKNPRGSGEIDPETECPVIQIYI